MARYPGNRVRGIRTPIPAGTLVGRPQGSGTGAGQIVPLSQLAFSFIGIGASIPGGAGSLPSIADGDVLANITGSAGQPVGDSLSAVLDHVFGSTEGDILQRGPSGWQVLAPGTAGDVLTTGGSGALAAWAAASSGSYTYEGAWNAFTGYSPGDVVTYGGSAYLCYASVSAPPGAPTIDGYGQATYSNNTSGIVTLSTTGTADFIFVACIHDNATVINNVTGTGLTFTKRASINDGNGDLELWCAPASAALSSEVITLTFSGLCASVITAFGVQGVNAFDSNGSIPGSNNFGSVTVSTTNSPDMILWISGTQSSSGTVTAGDLPSGFSLIAPAQTNAWLVCGYMEELGTLSSVTYPNPGSPSPALMIVDAAVVAATGNTPPTGDDLHWLSQGSGSSLITSVDSNFTVTGGGELELATIASGDLLANSTGSAAEPTATTLTALIDDAIGSTQGNILYRGASGWAVLAPGTSGNFLKTQGASANPIWAAQATGYITAVDSNFTVSGTTLELATIASGDVIGNSGASTAEPAAATMTAMLDRALGSTEGQILQRGSAAWQVLAPGTVGQYLGSGGAGALNAWGTPAGTTYSAGTGLGLSGTTFSLTTPVTEAHGGTGQTSLTAALDNDFGSTEGDILQRGSSTWGVLAPGTAGQLLQSGGSSALNAWANPVAPIGTAVNLVGNLATAGTSMSFTADQIIVGTSLTGVAAVLGSYSKTFNGTGTGAGGMDTGAIPTSGFLSLYAIFGTSGTSILGVNASTSSGTIYSGTHMPSGYTYSALIAIIPTNATPAMVANYVRGRTVGFFAKAIIGSPTASFFTSLSISTVLPVAAVSVNGFISIASGGTGAILAQVASDSTGIGQQILSQSVTGPASVYFTFEIVFLPTAQTIYYGASLPSGSSIDINVQGYSW